MALEFLQVGTIRTTKNDKTKLTLNLNQAYKDGDYIPDNLIALYDVLGEFIENPTKNGIYLQIQDIRKNLKSQFDDEKITEDQYEDRLEKLPDYIRYEITLVQET